MPEVCFCSFISTDGKCLKIRSEWDEDKFKLNILQDCDSWECNVTDADIRRELPGIDAKSYIDLSKPILTKKDKNKSCDYTVSEDVFSWQQRDHNKETIFSGFAHLKKVPYNNSIINFVDSFLSLNTELSNEARNLEGVNNLLEADTRNLMSAVQMEIAKKNDMETELLSKFYLLLQEKKDMVSLLQSLTGTQN